MTVAVVGGWVLTVDAADTQHRDGVVIVEGSHVRAVGDRATTAIPADAQVVDASGCLVMPGMINAHTHVTQTLLRGGPSHSRVLYDWLLNVVLPGLRAYGPGDLTAAVQLYCAEALRSGITTIVANEEPVGPDPEATARATLEAFRATGMRVAYALMYRDREPDAVRHGVDQVDDEPLPHEPVEQTLRLIEALTDDYGTSVVDRRLAVWPSPATTAVVSDDGLRGAHSLATRFGGRWALHLAETTTEHMVRPVSPVQHLSRLGCLDDTLLAAHCVHVDDGDIDLLARCGVNVVTNPVSNCYLGSGVAPAAAMVARGVRLALGTDDGNCNDSVNLLSDMKTFALLHRAVARDPRVLPPDAVVRMATIEAARSIGAADDLGSIEPGKRADIAILRADQPHMVPMHDPYAALVFQANGSEIDTVLIDGEIVLEQGRPCFVDDLLALCRSAGERSRRIVAAAALPIRPSGARS